MAENGFRQDCLEARKAVCKLGTFLGVEWQPQRNMHHLALLHACSVCSKAHRVAEPMLGRRECAMSSMSNAGVRQMPVHPVLASDICH